MKTLYLTRHGETMFNRQHRMQGWCDSPLTDLGREQARSLGRILAEQGIRLDAAVCSTAERAADTLELILGEMGCETLPYRRLKGIREVFYGELEAQQDFLAAHGAEHARTYYVQFGGEATDDVRDRMNATLTQLMRDQPEGSHLLAVGHGGANFNFLRGVIGMEGAASVLKEGWTNLTTCVYEFDEPHADELVDGSGTGPWRLVDVVRI